MPFEAERPLVIEIGRLRDRLGAGGMEADCSINASSLNPFREHVSIATSAPFILAAFLTKSENQLLG